MILLNSLYTWSFVTKKETGALLQEAFHEFAKQNPDISEKVKLVFEILKRD